MDGHTDTPQHWIGHTNSRARMLGDPDSPPCSCSRLCRVCCTRKMNDAWLFYNTS